ncbi:MAG: M20 family metallopeptidase [Anaerolineales bacterium]|nr:M20 family metallopeptidase [Anaerolineales bacterium]MCS7247830.1 M20 family metallopeptidase [Anaerolineales bacterium]MDW8161640.1 M20 family metallopeptidase [Anaerolineales bacterium]MDW8447865.1 M20 family metallopeptidase [Anaerolineales bacterium]
MSLQGLFAKISGDEIAHLTRELVRFDTTNPPGNERRAVEFVAESLKPFGFECLFLEHETQRATLLARLQGSGERGALVFNGHIDVVPVGVESWQHPPFEGVIDGGKVWGRGAADMKGGVAAMMAAAKAVAQADLALKGDLILTVTAGEEVDMLGARALAALPEARHWQAVIISEPTSNRLGLAERGVFWPEITTYGKTAHGSTPELGVNAVMMMVKLLAEFEKLDIPFQPHPVLGEFTRSVNTIHGGVKVNVVPDRCSVMVDMRTLPGQDHAELMRLLEAFLARLAGEIPGFRATIRLTYELPPAETPQEAEAVQKFLFAAKAHCGVDLPIVKVPFATEAGVFVPTLGLSTLILGPGDPALAHQPDEFVGIAEMEEAARLYIAAAVEMLAA